MASIYRTAGVVCALALVACGGSEKSPAGSGGSGATAGAGGAGPIVCEPVPGADTTFAVARSPESESIALARAIADRFISEHPVAELGWNWGEGTLLIGIADLYRISGDSKYADYLATFLAAHEDSYEFKQSDSCPPSVVAIELYRQTCDSKYEAVVDDLLRYLHEESLRTEHGGLNHLGTLTLVAPSLWVDSLFMFGTPLTRWGRLTSDATHLDFYADQVRIFGEVLQEDSGFLKHGWGWPTRQDPDVYWARGNSWVLAATGEYLQARAARGETDAVAEGVHTRLATAAIGSQDPATGLWWTVLNRPDETYLETSASALFALGLARGYRAGVLDNSVLPVIDRAMQGVRGRIETDSMGRPVVTGISGPTSVGGFDMYAGIEQAPDIDYGLGGVIMALLETSGIDSLER